MPGPSRHGQTRKNLKSQRVQTRLRKNETRRLRTTGLHIHKKDVSHRMKLGMYAAARALAVANRFKPALAAATPFENLYDMETASEIAVHLAKDTTKPAAVSEKVKTNFRGLDGAHHGGGITLRSILMLLLLAWIPGANAKWNEWSAPPDELNMFDTLYYASYFVQLAAGFAARGIDPAKAGTSLLVADAAGKTGSILRSASAIARSHNATTGKYPLNVQQKAYMGIELLAPFSKVEYIKNVIASGEWWQKLYTAKKQANAFWSDKATAAPAEESIERGTSLAEAHINMLEKAIKSPKIDDLSPRRRTG